MISAGRSHRQFTLFCAQDIYREKKKKVKKKWSVVFGKIKPSDTNYFFKTETLM